MCHFEVYLRLSEVILKLFLHFQMRGVRLRVRCFEFPEFWTILVPKYYYYCCYYCYYYYYYFRVIKFVCGP